MRPLIEFCASNRFEGTDTLLRRLEENPELDVLEYGCLGNCGECYAMPYALVNGEVITGEDSDGLYQAIQAKIAELEALDRLLDDL